MRVRATTRFKDMACPDCGTILKVGSNTRNAPRCVECGVIAYEASQREIAAKSGDAYKKWRDGIIRSLGESTRGSPPPLSIDSDA